jgi:hypothetical protein
MESPRTAKSLITLAEANGWTTEAVPLQELYVLRFTRDGHRIGGLWNKEDGFQGGYANPYAPRWPLVRFNYPQLKEVLQIPRDDFEWPEIVEQPDDMRQNMRWEREQLGYYLSGHPLGFVNMARFPDIVLADEFEDLARPGQWVQVLGLVEEADIKTSRRGNPWARFVITDLTGLVRCLAFGKITKGLVNGALVHAQGKPELRDEELTLIVSKTTEVSW